jgi:hypothetical protein
MKKPFSLFLVASFLLLSNASIGQSASAGNPLYQHLPPAADRVYEVNFNQIMAKGQLAPLLGMLPPSKNAHSALIFQIIKDPAAAGADLSHNIVATQTSATGKGVDTLSFLNIFVKLSDSAKFRRALTQAIDRIHVHRVPGKGFTAAEEHLGLAWNDQLLVVTLATRETPVEPAAHTPPAAPHRPIAEIAVEKSLAALAGFPTSSWLTNQNFLSGFASDADMHMWSTGANSGKMFAKMASKFAKSKSGMPPMAEPNFGNMADRPHPQTLSTLNFGNGDIAFRMTTFNKPEDAAAFRAAMDRPFNKDLIARLPNGLLLGWMAAHINLASLGPILDKYHAREKVDSMLKKKGLSFNDISAAFGGDFLLAAITPDSAAATDTVKKIPNLFFVASIADPAKMMALAGKLSAAAAPTDTAKSPFKNLATKLYIQDNLLVVSSSREKAKSYFDHPERRTVDLAGDDIQVMRVVIDLKAVGSFIGAVMHNDPKSMIFARISEKLDKFIVNTGLDGDNSITSFRITMADPSTNSLQTLMSIMH